MEKRQTVTYDKADLKRLVGEHAQRSVPDYKVESVSFNVQGEEDPSDWRAAQPLDYVLQNATVVLVKKEPA